MKKDDLQLPSSFNGAVRLFPLPNVILYPQVLLPLHIFEPRYRQMTNDALEDDRLIAMVLIQPGWENEHLGKPPICPVGCVGRIIADQVLPDGRYNLLLRGLRRIRIVQEVDQVKIYRQARVELLKDHGFPKPEEEAMMLGLLKEQVAAWLEHLGIGTEQHARLFENDFSLCALSDLLAFALPLPIDFKQSLLEELDIRDRIRLLLGFMEAHAPVADDEEGTPRPFPPDFSAN